jgi:hypothetical protein
MIHDEAGALRAIARAFWSVCGGCVAATACWMVWGLATPGDYFASGSPWLWFSLLASGATGGYAAFKARSKRFRVALLLLGLACAIFWLAVRNGWWVKSPPSAGGPFSERNASILINLCHAGRHGVPKRNRSGESLLHSPTVPADRLTRPAPESSDRSRPREVSLA